MQPKLWALAIFAFGLGLLLVAQIIVNNRYTTLSSALMRSLSDQSGTISLENPEMIRAKALWRIQLYEKKIKRFHLLHGMAVNRSLATRKAEDLCDSLLFSSLRFAALTKLSLNADAQEAWQNIVRSKRQNRWVRHPECATKSLSRDMLTGLLVALSQKPPDYQLHIKKLVSALDMHSGYFSHGPAYVSYLTPGLGQIIRYMAIPAGLSMEDLSPLIKDGYSTNEFSVVLMEPGYESHLAALAIWLEMEIVDRFNVTEKRSMIEHLFNAVVRPFARGNLLTQRHSWTTQQLVDLDPNNLFFRYLRLRAARALSPKMAAKLLNQLNEMHEFPSDRLPMNCDRRADYLWQRDSKSGFKKAAVCDVEFAGIDYLWMAGLLIESMGRSETQAAI